MKIFKDRKRYGGRMIIIPLKSSLVDLFPDFVNTYWAYLKNGAEGIYPNRIGLDYSGLLWFYDPKTDDYYQDYLQKALFKAA